MSKLAGIGFALAMLLGASRAQEKPPGGGNGDATTSVAAAAPKNPMQIGNALYEKGDYAGAADQYRQAALKDKFQINRAFAWFNLGNCHVQAKAYNKAIVAYRRSLEEAPTFTRTWMLLGEVYASLGAVGDAVPCFRRALEIDGPNVRAYQMLGELALKAGDIPVALENFDAALKLEPDQPDIYLAMAEANARIRDYPAAEKVMEDAILIIPLPPADLYFYLGQLYELGENDRKAVRAYEEGLTIDPKRTEYYLRVAAIHERNGDDFLSLLTLEQAVKAGIKKPEIRLKRGVLFFGQKRYDRALEEFQAALALGSLQGRRGIENIAAVYFNEGNKKKAGEVLSKLSQ
ncbi:MAG: tetratricopeptide repeat protein [Fibrobacteria bacterium]